MKRTNKFLQRLRRFSKENFKFILFTLFTIALAIPVLSFFSSSIVDTKISALTNCVLEKKKKEQSPFCYGEVKSEDGKNFNLFFHNADDGPGIALKRNNDTFFTPINEDGTTLLNVYFNEDIVQTSFLLSTQYNFQDVHYNLELLCGKFENISNSNGIYISETLATQLLKNSKSYNDLINEELVYDKKVFKILGVLDSKKTLNFEILLGKYFVISSYINNASTFKNIKYSFLMNGDYSSTYAMIYNIEHTIAVMDKLHSHYFNWQMGKFIEGETQNLIVNTINKSTKTAKVISSLVFSCFLIVSLLFFAIRKLKIGRFFPVSFSKNYKYTSYLSFLIMISAYLIYFIIIKKIGCLIVSKQIISFYDPTAFLLFTLLYFAFLISYQIIFKRDYKKILTSDKLNWYEVNI